MLVQSILKFITELKGFKNLASIDVLLLNDLKRDIATFPPDKKLQGSELQFLLDCFKIRWDKTVDSEHDYMLNPGLINQRWIAFAKELAPFTNKNYLQILLPTIINSIDFNNLTFLTETERLQNFYLGYGKRVLYRKRGLCEHLIDKNYALSTCRELRTSKSSAFTVEELSRLQSCKQVNGQFWVQGELFTDFWDFLRRKVFSCLQAHGKMSLDLLPHLLILIERYHSLKDNNDNYDLFKQSVNKFFKSIAKHKLEDINFFYGVEIPYKGKTFYLLDFLIAIHKADSYVLDEHFKALMEWLYEYNPVLKATNTKFELFYRSLQLGHNYIARTQEQSESLLVLCLRFLLSLFTMNFDFIPFTGERVSFWDISKPVFAEAGEMFTVLAPALAKNHPAELTAQYQKVMRQYVIPGSSNTNLSTWATRYQNVSDWYDCAKSHRFSKLGVYWYDPELIMHALSRYKSKTPELMPQINKLLDELMRTYAQDNPVLHKQLRVNILFSNFIKGLSAEEQRYLHLLFQLYPKNDVKKNFLNNCVYHIAHRLSLMGTTKEGGAIQFFSDIRRVDVTQFDISTTGVDHLNTIIDAFKDKIFSSDFTVDYQLRETMMTYLRSISRPILTTKEHEDAKSNANTLDYLGAPT